MKEYEVIVKQGESLVLSCKAKDEGYARNKAAVIQNLGSDALGKCSLYIIAPNGLTIHTQQVEL